MSSHTPLSSQESADSIWDSNELAGEQSASVRSTRTPARSSPSDGPESPTSVTSWHSFSPNSVHRDGLKLDELSMPLQIGSGIELVSGPAVFPAKTSVSPASDEDSRESDPDSPSPTSALWSDTDLRGSSWRTFPASYLPTAAEISPHFSGGYPNSVMAWQDESSTLAISAWRSDEGEYSSWPRVTLADVLEPTAPPRFFLSPRAAAGILRRASKRGRELPAALHSALTTLASRTPSPEPCTSDTTPTPTPSSPPVLLTMREGKEGGGKGPLLSENASLTLGTSQTQTLFDGPSVRRLTPVETERLMGWPDGHTIVAGWQTRASSRRSTPRAEE